MMAQSEMLRFGTCEQELKRRLIDFMDEHVNWDKEEQDYLAITEDQIIIKHPSIQPVRRFAGERSPQMEQNALVANMKDDDCEFDIRLDVESKAAATVVRERVINIPRKMKHLEQEKAQLLLQEKTVARKKNLRHKAATVSTAKNDTLLRFMSTSGSATIGKNVVARNALDPLPTPLTSYRL